jgi:dihydroorotase
LLQPDANAFRLIAETFLALCYADSFLKVLAMTRTTLIRNADVVFPSGVARANVLLADGRIASIDAAPSTSADEVIDATGLVLFPGLVDDQVHFREPGLTHKEDLATASAACAAGGVTSFLEMPNTKPSAINQTLIEEKYAIASHKSIVNHGFYIGATANNIEDLTQATGVPGIKIFVGSSTGDLLVDDQDALEQIFGETTLPICAHCEDETTVRENQERIGGSLRIEDHSRIRDHRAAEIATRRMLDLAIRHHHRFHVLHVSTAQEIPLLASHHGLITAEVCPHHWEFSIEDYARLGSLIQMNPSIKTPEDNRQLWQALIEGKIQVIATDHAPHTLEEKAKPYPESPSGLPAVENYFALLLDRAHRGLCTWEQIAAWTSDAPARVWGIVGKGRIAVGYDADVVLVDPRQVRTIENAKQWTKTKWSPWNGRSLMGWPVITWCGGRIVYRDGQVDASTPGSRLVFDHARGGYWNTPDGIGL